jgi:hypothetical protein
MLLHVRKWLNQKRLCLDLVHEDERNSMRYFAFHGKVTLARRFRQAHFCQGFHKNLWRMRHAMGQASFEAETQNQSRREGAGCRRTEFFDGG